MWMHGSAKRQSGRALQVRGFTAAIFLIVLALVAMGARRDPAAPSWSV
jgi:hypothetical protein